MEVIVETEQAAARLMQRMEEGQLSRAAFLLLSQMGVESVPYPNCACLSIG